VRPEPSPFFKEVENQANSEFFLRKEKGGDEGSAPFLFLHAGGREVSFYTPPLPLLAIAEPIGLLRIFRDGV